MTNKEQQLIRKWCKLRTPDGSKKFIDITFRYYQGLDPMDRNIMLREFKDYIFQVECGNIEPGPVEIAIPKYD